MISALLYLESEETTQWEEKPKEWTNDQAAPKYAKFIGQDWLPLEALWNMLHNRIQWVIGMLSGNRFFNITFASGFINPIWLASRVVDIVTPSESDEKSTSHIFHDPKIGGETQKNKDEACDKRGREYLNKKPYKLQQTCSVQNPRRYEKIA